MTSTRITQLRFYPGNARRGDIDLIADSLRVNGQVAPIVVNKGTHAPDLTDTILSGNHTTMAAQRLGWTHIDAHYVDLDEDACKRVVLVMNRSSDQATYELEELAALVGNIGNLDGTGFSQDDLDAMLEALDNTTDDLLEEGDGGDAPEGYDLTVECESANQRDTLKAKLISEGFTVS
ncbi:ParB N-terminal domain-containing protein [Corynebacterium sp. USCH3]|uniref:ParB N-terminal domain-containing protein n=1 Tax=Corynebacterium sp. USCH3 TaxID=3024840 RepID=UPI0030AC6B38